MFKKYKKIIISILIICIMILCMLIGSTYSSYISQIFGKSETEIAEPIFILEHTDKKKLDDTSNEIDYYFTIKNYNNDKKTDVNLKYIIEITPIQDEAIVLSLYKDNEQIALNGQKTSYITLSCTNKETHNYRLNVKYDKSNLDDCYDINSQIYIKASAIQD